MNVAITAVSGQLGSEIVAATMALLPNANAIGLARTPEKTKHFRAFGTDLRFTPTTAEENRNDRIGQHHCLGGAGRDHVSWSAHFTDLAEQRATS